MKKRISLLIGLVLTMACLTACGDKVDGDVAESTPIENDSAPVVDDPVDAPAGGVVEEQPADTVVGDTVGNQVRLVFDEMASQDLEDIAEAIKNMEGMEIAVDYMHVEEGFLNGFSADITGFTDGVVIMPFIGSIPYVSYVFETEDPAALEATLLENADLRWNVCTAADEIVTSVSGNKVFVVMAPYTFEQ